MAFGATHLISGSGAASWTTPDVSTPPGPRLEPFLPVEIVAVWGDWARIRCENGWEAWTDGRTLTSAPQPVTAYPLPAAPVQPLAPPGHARSGTGVRTHMYQVLAPIGGGLAVIGGLLPWLTADGFRVNGWDISLWGLIANRATDTGIRAGLVVTLAGLAVAAAFVRLPAWSLLLLGMLASNPSGLLVMRWLTAEGPKATLGPGAPLGAVGGVLIGYAAWDARKGRNGRWA